LSSHCYDSTHTRCRRAQRLLRELLCASPRSLPSPRRTHLLLYPQPTLTLDRLSSLPVELLREIYELAYPRNEAKPSAPLSKRHLPFFLERLYSSASVKSYVDFARLCRAITRNRGFGVLIKHLSVDLPFVERRRPGVGGEKEKVEQEWPFQWLNPNKVIFFFRHLSAANSIRLSGSTYLVQSLLSPVVVLDLINLTDLSLRSTFDSLEDPFHPAWYSTLPFLTKLESLTIDVERKADTIVARHPPPQGLSPILMPSLFALTLRGPLTSSPSVAQLIGSFADIFDLSLSDYYAKTSLVPLVKALEMPERLFRLALDAGHALEYDPALETVLLDLKGLEFLELAGGCASSSPSFYDTLRKIPDLSSLDLGMDAPASTKQLIELISGPRRHPKLKALRLGVVWGNSGDTADGSSNPFFNGEVRPSHSFQDWPTLTFSPFLISPPSIPSHFPSFAPCLQWILPDWTRSFSRKGLERLIRKAKTAGVKVDGDSVEAMAIEDAFVDEQKYYDDWYY
jgi:hypothetical protein